MRRCNDVYEIVTVYYPTGCVNTTRTTTSTSTTLAPTTTTTSSSTSTSTSTTTTTTTNSCSDITIGTQVWTRCNLDVDTYANGDPIPQITDPVEWSTSTIGAWCYPNNDPVLGAIYGKLYNFYAVGDVRGIAPAGYHVPTYQEFVTLTNYLGGLSVAGGKLKSTGTSLWLSPNTGATNESGFTGLPGGMRFEDGSFLPVPTSQEGHWWSSTRFINLGWQLVLSYNNNFATISNGNTYNLSGFSVRLIKD